MHGAPSLGLLDFANKLTQRQIEDPTNHKNLELPNVGYVSSNAKSSSFGVILHILARTTKP